MKDAHGAYPERFDPDPDIMSCLTLANWDGGESNGTDRSLANGSDTNSSKDSEQLIKFAGDGHLRDGNSATWQSFERCYGSCRLMY